ncbi:uridine kinase family protein [Vacuolonema iberomarrocanum]|uniref:uridine kinase family protein n=1 Tax=Vacuolonema iberomarrocanum TaxID=3454632 RepID=UPI0019F12E25|nr:(d)CMP kinase [filamentous cyanobacterium LEGE 07170]
MNIEKIINLIQGKIVSNNDNWMFTLAIDGPSASGKSTLARLTSKSIKKSSIVHVDDFYKTSTQRKNQITNNNLHGIAFDLERLKQQALNPIALKKSTNYQIYNWTVDRLTDIRIIQPVGLIIVEGIYSLRQDLQNYYDFKIWLEVPKKLCEERVLERDRVGIGNYHNWKNDYRPAEEQYVKLQNPGNSADLVLTTFG